ncbi:hypothetical protein [Acinetobacter sp. YH16038]|uniref:hypothetical protein n=1 Tax=Acinetobacter sp. YH16038 TaxID=2601183 RepID=UPI0015D31B89|nr:hypothetical protein [Acinetobacter sp. YH16038]
MRAIVMVFVEEAFMVFLAKFIMTIMLVKMRFRRCFMETTSNAALVSYQNDALMALDDDDPVQAPPLQTW